jgi:hypothetical protein
MESKIETLAQLFAYLAQNPTALEEFKKDPAGFMANPLIQLSSADQQFLGVETEPAYFRYTPVYGTKSEIKIDFNGKTVAFSERRPFHAELDENVTAIPSKGMKVETKETQLIVDLLDYSVVHVLSIPIDYCKFDSDNNQIEVFGPAKISQNGVENAGKVRGYITTEGDFDIAVTMIPPAEE